MVVGGGEHAGATGLRVVGVDRPGFGLSDPRTGRTALDWADDVAALADALGIERFGVTGVSAGSRYALACGYALADRVAVVGVVAWVLPVEWYPDDELVALVARDHDAAVAEARRFVSGIAADPDAAVDQLAHRPPPDGPVYARPEVRSGFVAAYAEALRQGIEGVAADVVLTNTPWEFALDEVTVPVRWWHGDADPLHSAEVLHRATAVLPDCELTIVAGAGHALGFDIGGEVLHRLATDLFPD